MRERGEREWERESGRGSGRNSDRERLWIVRGWKIVRELVGMEWRED